MGLIRHLSYQLGTCSIQLWFWTVPEEYHLFIANSSCQDLHYAEIMLIDDSIYLHAVFFFSINIMPYLSDKEEITRKLFQQAIALTAQS